MSGLILKRVCIDDFSHPYRIDHDTRDGVVMPLFGFSLYFEDETDGHWAASPSIWLEAFPNGPKETWQFRREWSGVWLRPGEDSPEQVADALEALAAQIRSGKFGASGDDIRSGNDVNESVAEEVRARFLPKPDDANHP